MHLNLEKCQFSKNIAEDSGLALYTSEGVIVSVTNSSFEHDMEHSNGIQQSLLFAAGIISHLSGYFEIANTNPAYAVGPIFVFYIHEVKHMYIETECPSFYKHITQYTSKFTDGHSISDLKYECSPCSDNYYTIDSEYNIISYGGENMTFSDDLLVGEKSTDTCRPCPYGGLCTGNNVIPRPNYWGLKDKGELVFQQCPVGYCCSGRKSSTCNRFDHCEKNRTGILCGACQKGFSVSILTGVCTPNTQCGGDQWFWLFMRRDSFPSVIFHE